MANRGGAGPGGSPRTHAARHLVLGRRAACGLGAGITLLMAWAVGATWLLAGRDDLSQTFFVQDTDRRYAYEDRIKALQTELERAVTLNLVERTNLTSRLESLARRQADIEGRQAWLKRAAGRLSPHTSRDPDADLTTGSLGGAARPSEAAPWVPAEPFTLRLQGSPSADATMPRDRLSALEGSLARIAEQELRAMGDLQARAAARLRRVRGALAALGSENARLDPKPVGGPLVALPAEAAKGAFGPLAAELQGTFDELDGAVATAKTLPLGRPLAGELETTSSFGYRLDPFTRGAALHTGADYRAEHGAAVRATASGRVVAAEYSGGYGNLVEIDHGRGLTTRYGHLSGFTVSAGMRVEAGEIIGRAGSTGRSTGTHLHYETRSNGEPVNPARFIEAGAQMAEWR